MTPMCLSCGKGCADYTELALHISREKKGGVCNLMLNRVPNGGILMLIKRLAGGMECDFIYDVSGREAWWWVV